MPPEDTDWLHPSTSVLVGLASLFTHCEELEEEEMRGASTPDERLRRQIAIHADRDSISALLKLDHIKDWVRQIPPVLLPEKRVPPPTSPPSTVRTG
jgi:hypothetical protein